MPKRTNPFQELLSLIHWVICPEGSKVTDSYMAKVHGLEGEREIDILFEIPGGLYRVRIAIEAKDEDRPFDQTALDEYLGKYKGPNPVVVDRVVIVSRNGFTPDAVERAAAAGIHLMTLDEAKTFDWAKMGPQYGNLPRQSNLHFRVAPHVCKIEITPRIRGDRDGTAAKEGRLICDHGTDYGTPFEFAHRAAFQKPDDTTREKLKEVTELAKGRPEGAGLMMGFEMSHYQLRFKGKDRRLAEMKVTVHVVDTTVPMECKAYELAELGGKPQIFHHSSGVIGDRRIQFVMPQGLKSKTISLRIGKDTTPKKKADERKAARKRARKKRKE